LTISNNETAVRLRLPDLRIATIENADPDTAANPNTKKGLAW
jgi:hypothetical protein